MQEQLTDIEQEELVKNWIKKNSLSVLLAVLVGLGIGYGYRYFKHYRAEQKDKAAVLYMKALDAATEKNAKQLYAFDTQLTKDYSGTVYPALSKLLVAARHVQDKQYDAAVKDLTYTIHHTNNDVVLGIARVRLTRVLAFQQKKAEASATASKIKLKPFRDLV